jgi:hypothetical protein
MSSYNRYMDAQSGQSPEDYEGPQLLGEEIVMGQDTGDPCDQSSAYFDPDTCYQYGGQIYDSGQGGGGGQIADVCDPSSYYYDPNDPQCAANQVNQACDYLVMIDLHGNSGDEVLNPPIPVYQSQVGPYSSTGLNSWGLLKYQSAGPDYLVQGDDGLLYYLKFAQQVNGMSVSQSLQEFMRVCPFYTGVPSQDYANLDPAGYDQIPVSMDGDVIMGVASPVTRLLSAKHGHSRATKTSRGGHPAVSRSSLRAAPGVRIPANIRFIYKKKGRRFIGSLAKQLNVPKKPGALRAANKMNITHTFQPSKPGILETVKKKLRRR